MTDETCAASVVIDFDSADCHLAEGHDGMHECWGEGGKFRWELLTVAE